MTEAVKIRRNSFYSFISATARVAANFVLFWFIARFYAEEIFGQFTFAQSLSTNFLFLADFGFDILLITEISRNQGQSVSLFRKYYSLKLIFSLVALLSMWLIALFIPLSFQVRILILIFSFFMIFSALTNFIYAFFKGYEKLEYEAGISFAVNIILLISTIILIILKSGILLIGVAFLLSRLIGFISALIYAKRLNKDLSFKLSFEDFSETKKKIFTFGIFLIFNNLLFQIDTILLGFWKGDYDVGIYQSVFKIILLPLIIPDIFTNAFMPTLSRLFSSNTEQWEKTGYLLHKIFAACVMPISIFLFVYSEQIVHLLYGGEKYIEAIPVLRILTVTMFLRFSFEPFSLMLTTSNRISIRMWAVIAGTVVNIILNYFIIYKYGALGASFVSLVSNILVLLIYFISLRNLFIKWILNTNQIFFYIYSLILFISFWFLRDFNIYLAITLIPLLLLIYLYKIYFNEIERRIIFSTEIGITPFRK